MTTKTDKGDSIGYVGYDVEICGVCHGNYIMGDSKPESTHWYCPNCKDSPRPGYIIIPRPISKSTKKRLQYQDPEFRPNEKDE